MLQELKSEQTWCNKYKNKCSQVLLMTYKICSGVLQRGRMEEFRGTDPRGLEFGTPVLEAVCVWEGLRQKDGGDKKAHSEVMRKETVDEMQWQRQQWVVSLH